ncbi:MAG: PAS domain S-box protein [Thermodesulfobacteriota bacterium]|nr:PAS domain S-box protein [Thermodesulfobacteriota bacterium]
MEYADLVENSNDMIQVVGFDGRVIYANRMWQKTLGYNGADLLELNFFDLLCDDCHGKCQGRIQTLLAGESVPHFEIEYKTHSGH